MGALTLLNGVSAVVVLTGDRAATGGAVVVESTAREGEKTRPAALKDMLPCLSPAQIVEIYCIQERAFGQSGLPAPSIS